MALAASLTRTSRADRPWPTAAGRPSPLRKSRENHRVHLLLVHICGFLSLWRDRDILILEYSHTIRYIPFFGNKFLLSL